MLIPASFIVSLAMLAFMLPRDPMIRRALLLADAVLVLGAAVLFIAVLRAGRTLTLTWIPRKPHYVQACVQGALFAYWAWHVTFVRALIPLVFAQLLFAYAVSVLLTWARRDDFELGFGPFPITISINFFLVFRPEWFHWQFVIVALGFLAKEFIRWERDGASRHIFNPSSFPLAVFSLVLLLTGRTDTTLGIEIAQTLFNPPHMHLAIFLVALAPQILFGVTTMTMAAVLTTYGFGLIYFAATGTYFFIDSYIPIAVFLGMHLLFTDPATSPRTSGGRIVFGVLYGIGTMVLYAVLKATGQPSFYDKLLPIPVLNLTVILLDRITRSRWLSFTDVSKLGPAVTGARRRLATAGIWAAAFVAMSLAGGVGDDHPGQYLPFWEQTCRDGSEDACQYVATLQENFCERGSGWACNEFAIHLAVNANDPVLAFRIFGRGCELNFQTACANAELMRRGQGGVLAVDPPQLADLPIVLRGSKGPIQERDSQSLTRLACERGWDEVCASPL